MAKLLKRLLMKHMVADSFSFASDQDFRMDLAVSAGELRDASISDYRRKGLLIDVTYAEAEVASYPPAT